MTLDGTVHRARATRRMLRAGAYLAAPVDLAPWQRDLARRVVLLCYRDLVALGHERDAREVVRHLKAEIAERQGQVA